MDDLDIVELYFAALLIVMMGMLWWLDRTDARRKRADAPKVADKPSR
jgi:hypothetical protein